MNKRSVGTFYEDAAVSYLEDNGIEIVEKNFRCRLGEIDLIGKDENCLIFFEVKYRRNPAFGYSFEAVDTKKQRKIVNCARYYLAGHPTDSYIRFDVVGIDGNTLTWIKDAFEA